MALIASLAVFFICFSLQVLLDHFNVGEVSVLGESVPTGWVAQAYIYADQMADFALAGVALSLFDRVAGWHLSLPWALTERKESAYVRAAVILGWSAIAVAFVLASSSY